MSQNLILLCGAVLRECHGEVIEEVGVNLLKKGPTPMKVLAFSSKLKQQQVKKALFTMIQQNMVTFTMNKRGFVEYSLEADNVLMRMHFPRLIYITKLLYVDSGELLMEEMVQHGQIQMSRLVCKVTDKLNQAFKDENKKFDVNQVRETFEQLNKTQFVIRCGEVEPHEGKTPPVPSFDTKDQFVIPQVNIAAFASRKRKRPESPEESSSKRLKLDDLEAAKEDENIFWKINYSRFLSYLRDQTIINAVSRKFDKRVAEILRAVLRLSEVITSTEAVVTTPVSANEVFKALPKDLGISRAVLDQYLSLLAEDSMDFFLKTGDNAGGMYAIHFQKALKSICQAHIESVVQQKFGSKCLRIFRLLLLKKQLEQKQIEDKVMIQSKEVKAMLYKMFGEKFISLTEVPKTPDYAPSRTFYLFSVNIDPIARMLLDSSYKAIFNLVTRRHHELLENKRLLDKQQRVEAVLSGLDQAGADDVQRQEVEELIIPAEKVQLELIKNTTKKLEQSEIQLADTVFVLSTYLKYAQMKE